MADEPFLLVRSSASDEASGSEIAMHAHDWHQLIYVMSGVAVVRTDGGSWLAPPSWAVWVPSGDRHAIRFVGQSSLRTLYLCPGTEVTLRHDCCSLSVSGLLRELILRTVELGMLDRRDPTDLSLTRLIAAELSRTGPPPFALPQPTSELTKRAAKLIEVTRSDSNMSDIARSVGIGLRTLERRFRVETGLTPGRWQQQARLLKGLELIASGALVKTAAAETGFSSPSAYVAAFGRLFGTTPLRYFSPPQ